MTDEAKLIVNTLRACAVETQCSKCVVFCGNDECLFTAAAKLIESLSAELERTKHERDAAIADINMVCQCDVCTRMCKYDKPNPYCECADFEWRGIQEEHK